MAVKKNHLIDFESVKSLNLEEYFYRNNLDELIGVKSFVRPTEIGPNDTFEKEGGEVFSPDCADLSRLHAIVQIRKCLTVLELGGGTSTKVIAHSLMLNQSKYLDNIAAVRRSDPFQLHSIESEKHYAEITTKTLGDLSGFVQMHVIEAVQSSFGPYGCGRYKEIPSLCPDLIYIDGPSPYSYKKEDESYFDISHPDITNVTSDLLLLEPYLLPGTFVIFDGLTNNARFNRRNLQRNWVAFEDTTADYTMMVLDEEPLGIHHKNQIRFINES